MADNFTQIKNELIRSTKLTPNEKVVLFVLLTYGTCKEIFVGQKKLAEYCKMSRKTIVATVKELKKKRLLSTTVKPDRSTLVYKLNTKAVVTLSNNVVTESDRGCNGFTQGVVTESDTSNKSLSNKNIVIKNKGDVFELPDMLNKETWAEWVQFRKELKKPLKPSTIKAQIKFLVEHEADHVVIIQNSIRSGWMGLHKLNGNGKNNQDAVTGKSEWQERVDAYEAEENKCKGKSI